MSDSKVVPISNKGNDIGFAVDPPDERLENGPIPERKCTDSCCCLIYILFTLAMFVIEIYGFANGDPYKLASTFDYNNNICGKGAAENYPYLYLANPTSLSNLKLYSVCVSECPSSLGGSVDCYQDYLASRSPKCTTDLRTNKNDTFISYNTSLLWKKVCSPIEFNGTETLQSLNTTLQNFGIDEVEDWLQDLKNTWVLILGIAGAACIIGFVYMVFMRCCAGVVVWLSVFFLLSCIIFLGILCYNKSKNLSTQNSQVDTAQNTVQTSTDDNGSDENSRKALLITAYVLWGLAAVLFIALCCFYHRIQLAIAVMKSAALFIIDVPTSLVVPPLLTFFLIMYYAWWIATHIFIFSMGSIQKIDSWPIGKIKWTTDIRIMNYVHIFGVLWNGALFMALSQFVLASACAIWYFCDKEQGPHKPVLTSFWRAFRYHFGSLAFGAFIIAVVQSIRIILAYLHKKAKETGLTKQNKLLEYLFRCLQCYMACFERFIRFVNKTAYIQIAIAGKNFCSSAKNGFQIVWNNPLRFSIVAGLGEVFNFIGKCAITFISTLIGYLVVTNMNYYKKKLSSPVFPTIAFFVISYIVGNLFISVYSMACDTILQTFCVDETLQKQKGNSNAQYAPEPLKEFFDKHDKNE